MNTCETCRYYMASPLQEPCESCHRDGVIGHDPPNWEGPINADRIRAMSDKKLAHYLNNVETDGRVYGPRGEAYWLDWLRQEAHHDT